jgi:predicted PurR-regulated permease PerM
MKNQNGGSASHSQNLSYKLLALLLLVYILFTLKGILIPLVFAGILSFLLFPLVHYLEAKKVPRVLSILLALLLSLAILGLIVYVVVDQVQGLDSLIPQLEAKSVKIFQQSQHWITQYHLPGLDKTKLMAEAQKYLGDLLKSSSSLLSTLLGSTGNFLLNLSLLPLYIFLFLLYRDHLKEFLMRLFKTIGRSKIQHTLDKIVTVVGSYMSGLFKVIMIVGILNSICLYFIGVEQAAFFGFFAAFMVLIPYIGIAIGAILPMLVAFISKDSYMYPLAVAICFYAVQFLEGNFITPYVVGNQISINPLTAIVSLLLFGSLWGMAGLVLALPLTAIIKVLLDSSASTKAWAFLMGEGQDA